MRQLTDRQAKVLAHMLINGEGPLRDSSMAMLAESTGLGTDETVLALSELQDEGFVTYKRDVDTYYIPRNVIGRKPPNSKSDRVDKVVTDVMTRWNSVARELGLTAIRPTNTKLKKWTMRVPWSEYTLDQFEAAIRAAATAPWLTGKMIKKDGKWVELTDEQIKAMKPKPHRHLEFEYITRTDKLDKWIAEAERNAPVAGTKVLYADKLAELVAKGCRASELPKPPDANPEWMHIYFAACDQANKRQSRAA